MAWNRVAIMQSTSIKYKAPAGYRAFVFVATAFVGTLLISNVAAQKLIPVGPFVFSGGILLFPFTYIFGDALTEVYGYARARQVIWCGFVANGVMALFLALVVALPAAPGWALQDEFATVLAMVPRIVVASVLAYWVGEFTNSYVMAKMKIAMEGRHLWMRTIGSTMIGQAADTVVFVIIAFLGIIPSATLITTMWSAYIFKVAYEVIATPLTYKIIASLKAIEGVDVFDRSTNFTPFSLNVGIPEGMEPNAQVEALIESRDIEEGRT